MEGSIGKRYVPEKPILPLPRGMIFLGKDLSLNRHVILYGVDYTDETFAAQYIRQLREASQFTGDNFMHILDLGRDSAANRLMAVLKPCNGKPLIQHIGRQTMDYEESVRLVCELGVTMQKAYAEGIPQFSVHADNLWLSEERQLVVMNYWETGSSRHRGVPGLCGLLYQLLTGSQTIPSSLDSLELLLREAVHEISSQQKDDLMRLIRRSAGEEGFLQEFVYQLRQQLSFRAEQQMTGAKPAAASVVPAAIESGIRSQGREARDDIRGKQVEEQSRRKGYSSTYGTESTPKANKTAPPEEEVRVEDTVTKELETEEEGEKRSFGWIAKRVVIYGIAFVGIVVLAGAILIGLLDNRHPGREEDPSFAEQTPATPQTQPQPTETPKESKPAATTDKVNPPASGEPVQAPNLIGLPRDQAEKQALASGLHYEFVLEQSDQPGNTVFKQDPMPNAQLKSGDNIKFWVSKGP